MPISQKTVNSMQSGFKRMDAGRLSAESAWLDIMGLEAEALAQGASTTAMAQFKPNMDEVKVAMDALKNKIANANSKAQTLFGVGGTGIPPFQTGC
jgi:hypothetical protein